MPKTKAVKVRKWITCAEPGCKRRAGTSKPYCGEHLKKFEKQKGAAARRRMDREREVRLDKKRRREKEAARASGDAMRKKIADDRKERARVAELVRKRSKKEKIAAAAGVGSRLVKAHCEKCSYTIRLSRKWIEVKRPLCPVCLKNMVTELDGAAADPRQLTLKPVKKGRADPAAAKKIGKALKGGV